MLCLLTVLPLYHYKMSIVSCYLFILKCILSDRSLFTPIFSGCHLLVGLFSILSFWVCIYICSWDKSLEGSIWLCLCFLIQSANLYPFIGEFSPFSFRVIIDAWRFPVDIFSFSFLVALFLWCFLSLRFLSVVLVWWYFMIFSLLIPHFYVMCLSFGF